MLQWILIPHTVTPEIRRFTCEIKLESLWMNPAIINRSETLVL
jgi:hypothetical protein